MFLIWIHRLGEPDGRLVGEHDGVIEENCARERPPPTPLVLAAHGLILAAE